MKDDYIGIGLVVDIEDDVDMKFDVDVEVEVEVEVDDEIAGMYALRYRLAAAVWIARDGVELSRVEQCRSDDDDICDRVLTMQSPPSSSS